MTIKLLIEKHWEFLSLKGGCTGLSESTHVKIPHFCLMSQLNYVWKQLLQVTKNYGALKAEIGDLDQPIVLYSWVFPQFAERYTSSETMTSWHSFPTQRKVHFPNFSTMIRIQTILQIDVILFSK